MLSGSRGLFFRSNLPRRQEGDVIRPSNYTNSQPLAAMGPRVSNEPQLIQDMPPKGGYPPIRVRRNLRQRLWGAKTLTIIGTLTMLYGWYKLAQGWAFEEMHKKASKQLHSNMIPFLQGERDIAEAVKNRADKKALDKFMKDSPDFNIDEKFFHVERN
ncbi:NADH dehydrogenase (ubiquinone) 1 alpha subcomplex subunit 13 [Acrasis kona]|uniref:NADH dehydrogenase [ubiquinone] 1 alpha subcomplex subunit 13 n=1 Tax=Acrasis kona TaxID=1008807 RepID=A0AAW2YZ72_9EUKA